MNRVLENLERAATHASANLIEDVQVTGDTIRDSESFRRNIATVREYSRMYSAQTARAGAAIKLAGVLGLKKDELFPVWKQLTGIEDKA